MTYGPIELLVVGFPGNKFTGEIAPALGELVDTGLINIIDILFVHKDADGVVNALELADLDEDTWAVFDPLVSEIAGLLNQDDAQRLCESLPVNSSAGILLFENAWAAKFVTALQNANAKLILNERIPRAVIDEMLAQAEQAEEVA
jgi:hypothetical protein